MQQLVTSLCLLMFLGGCGSKSTDSHQSNSTPSSADIAQLQQAVDDGEPRVSHTESGAPTASADSDQIPLEFNLDDPYATHLWFKSEEERRSRIREPLVQREEGEKFEQYMQTFVGKRVKIVLTFFSVGNDNTLFTGKSLAGFGVVTRERLKIGTDISEGFARSLRKDDRFFGEATIDKVENRGLRLIVSDLTAIEELAEWNGLPKRNQPPEANPATPSPVLTDEEKLEALVNRVRPGMTSGQVTSILGQPDAKERKDLGDFNPAKRGQILEIWTWKTDPIIMLSFVDGSLRDGGTPGYDVQKGFTPKQP